MKYTKGEWKLGEDNDVFVDDCACVAKVCGAPEGIDESLANAQLISAAPDMYKALRHTLIALENKKDMQGLNQQENLLLIEVTKALSKAEGREV